MAFAHIAKPLQAGLPKNTVVTDYPYNYRKMTGYLPTEPRLECGNCPNPAVGYSIDWAMDVCQTCIDSHKLINITGGANRPECDNCPNVAVGYCYDWAMNVCQMCINKHKLWDISSIQDEKRVKQTIKNASNPREKHGSNKLCPRHPNKYVSMFCVTCQITSCNKCFKFNHNKHDCIQLEKAAEQAKSKLIALTQRVKTRGIPITGVLSSIDNHIRNIDKANIESQDEMDEFYAPLEDHQDDVHMGFSKVCEAKKNTLKKQRKELEGVCAEMESVVKYADQLCKFASQEEVLDRKRQVADRIEQLEEKKYNLIHLHESDSMHTKAHGDAHNVISRFGNVVYSPLPNLSSRGESLKSTDSSSGSPDNVRVNERQDNQDRFIPVNVTRASGQQWPQSTARRVPRNTSVALQAMAQHGARDNSDISDGRQSFGPRFDRRFFKH